MFVLIVNANFVPCLQDTMARGFANLEPSSPYYNGDCMNPLPPRLAEEK